LVEEFMLLANVQVADKIASVFPNHAVLRRHPRPSENMFEDLIRAAGTVGIKMNCDTSKQLADSLDAAVKKETPYFNKLMRIMATRCMTQAVYFGSGDVPPNEFRHYGLAAEIYTLISPHPFVDTPMSWSIVCLLLLWESRHSLIPTGIRISFVMQRA
jgi:exosome complex exonuclease DIS3/RRP44